jgi:hypothetical protein
MIESDMTSAPWKGWQKCVNHQSLQNWGSLDKVAIKN